jgi:hypothetical protein
MNQYKIQLYEYYQDLRCKKSIEQPKKVGRNLVEDSEAVIKEETIFLTGS